MSAWRPIETAPRDGTAIIVWPPTYVNVTSTAKWDTKASPPFWRRADGVLVPRREQREPTHWLPVLAGPDDGGDQ